MIDLKNLTIKKAHKMMEKKEISVSDLVGAYKKVIDEKNGDINAYLEVFDDTDELAKKYDGEDIKSKPLFGIPFAMKDNILIKGKIASSGSKILENYRATYDATVTKKLKDAGAIFLGRTNMDEFAMGVSTENSAFGVTRNPYDLERVPGGSSGGPAAAVAMDGCLVALGSDTGGSIRQPAGFCNAVGLNPTYGAVSRFGLMAMASSFDQIGPITKNVEDAEIVFDVIKGDDPKDSTSSDSNISKQNNKKEKLRIGILKYNQEGISDIVSEYYQKTLKDLKDLGHEVIDIEIPHIDYSLPCYYILVPAEVSTNLARYDGVKYGLSKGADSLLENYMETRAGGFGKEVRRRIMLGAYVLSAGYYDAYYSKAQKVRAIIRKEFEEVFKGVDAIVTPTSPTQAFKIGEKSNDPLQMYLEDIFTAPAKVAGVPAISIPAPVKEEELPIGMQIIAPWFREDVLFNLGKQLTKEN